MAADLDEKKQKELSIPLADPSGVDQKDKEFLELVIKLINEGKISLYGPETLINKAVYNKLEDLKKAGIDIETMNLLSAIREIKGLFDAGYKDTYQMKNLVQRVRNTKERIEAEGGDLFII